MRTNIREEDELIARRSPDHGRHDKAGSGSIAACDYDPRLKEQERDPEA